MPSKTPAKKPRDALVVPVLFTAAEKGTMKRLLGHALADDDLNALQFLCATARHRLAQDRPTEAHLVAELQPIANTAGTLADLLSPSALTPEAKASSDLLLDGSAHAALLELAWELRKAIERLSLVDAKGAHKAYRAVSERTARADLAAFYRSRCMEPDPESEGNFVAFGMRHIVPSTSKGAAAASWLSVLHKAGKKRPSSKTPK